MIGVTAKLHRTCSEVLGNLLTRYDYRRDHVSLKISESDEQIQPDASIATLDNHVIIIAYRDDLEEYGWQINKNNIPAALNSPNKSLSSSRGDDTKSDSFFGKLNADNSDILDNSSNGSPYKIVKSNVHNNSSIKTTSNTGSFKLNKRGESLDSGDIPNVMNYRPSLKNLANHNHFQSHKEFQSNHFYDSNIPPALISSKNFPISSTTTTSSVTSSTTTNTNNKTVTTVPPPPMPSSFGAPTQQQSSSSSGIPPPPLPPKNVATINSVLVGQMSNPPPRPPPLSSIGNMNKFSTTTSASVTATAGDASYV